MPNQLLSKPLEWAQTHEPLLWWLAVASVLVCAVILFAVAWVLVHLPRDYFLYPHRYRANAGRRGPVIHVLLRSIANLVGGAFLVAGLLMLFLPGQGALTTFVGMMLIDFPGKDRLMRYTVSRPRLRSAIDSLRKRAGREPLALDDIDR